MPRFIVIAKSLIFAVEMFVILTHNERGHLSDV